MIVGRRASVCGYIEDCTPPLSGSGARPLLAKRDPFCALQACLKVRLLRLSRWSRCRFLMSFSYTEQLLAQLDLLSYLLDAKTMSTSCRHSSFCEWRHFTFFHSVQCSTFLPRAVERSEGRRQFRLRGSSSFSPCLLCLWSRISVRIQLGLRCRSPFGLLLGCSLRDTSHYLRYCYFFVILYLACLESRRT